MVRPRHRPGLALAFALAACNGGGGGGTAAPAVHSMESDVLGSTPFAGRLAVRRGCLVILRNRAAFTGSPRLDGDDLAGSDVPLFLEAVEHGTDPQGFFLVPGPGRSRLRIGDLVEGVGGPLWSEGEPRPALRRLMLAARPAMKRQCGERIVQVRFLKPYGRPGPA